MTQKRETRSQKFEREYAEALARIENAKADGASESVIRWMEQSADMLRRQSIATLRTRKSNASGRAR